MLSHGLHYGTRRLRGDPLLRHRARARRSSATTTTSSGCSKSAELYYLDLPYSTEEIGEATKELIRRNGLRSCYIRPLAFRGYGEMGLYAQSAPIEVIVAVWPWGAYLGEEGKQNGIRAKVSSWRPDLARQPDPARQGLGPVPELDPRQDRDGQRRLRRGDPARPARLRLRGLGREHLRRSATARSSRRRTSPRSSTASRRKSVIQIARDLGYTVVERDIARAELYLAEEVFLTGTAAELVPVREIDDHELGEPGEITRRDPGEVRGRAARPRRGVPRVARPGRRAARRRKRIRASEAASVK